MSALLSSSEESYQLWLDNVSRADAVNAIINQRVFKEVLSWIPDRIDSQIQETLDVYRVSKYIKKYFNSCRIIGYILGKDKYDLQKIWFVYMNPDDRLSYRDIQNSIPSEEIHLTQEGVEDDVMLHGLILHGLTLFQPDPKYFEN
jgi:hypothetical protein